MADLRPVEIWFDFVSPYSYLALAQAEQFAARHGVQWRPRPVVYAALLDATGLVGPAEIDIKRRYTFTDIRRAAALAGIPLVGPPAHPFRSLEALRVATMFLEDARCLALAVEIASRCWGHGADITDVSVLGDAVRAVGLDATSLASRTGAADTKLRLRQLTEAALERGVFGVPTFAVAGTSELFWGHDRLGHLAARLAGELPDMSRGLDRLLSRPRGADRTRRPPAR